MQRPVMIADDDANTVETLSFLLKTFNYEVNCVLDGRDVLSLASSEIPQAIILDIGLPTIDGLMVAKELRHNMDFDTTTLIAFSGHSETEYVRRAQSYGIDYYLVKPIDAESLLACIAPGKYSSILNEKASLRIDAKFKFMALSKRGQREVWDAQERYRTRFTPNNRLQF